MYKVFFNEKLIIVTVPTKITLKKFNRFSVESFTKEDTKKWFESFIKGDKMEACLVHSDPEIFFSLFQSVFKPLPAAGGVVVREKKLLFIFRNGKWDLPKGKIDRGETEEEAAVREVEEECGIDNIHIIKPIPSTYHIYQSTYHKDFGEWIFKKTYWFEMKFDGTGAGTPQLEEGITKVKWFLPGELDEVFENTYENLKPIISLYRT